MLVQERRSNTPYVQVHPSLPAHALEADTGHVVYALELYFDALANQSSAHIEKRHLLRYIMYLQHGQFS